MKTGVTVLIYKDPETEKVREGRAYLIEMLGDYGKTELWNVLFIGDDKVVSRYIKKTTNDE